MTWPENPDVANRAPIAKGILAESAEEFWDELLSPKNVQIDLYFCYRQHYT